MENFIKIECCSCGVLWAVSKELDSNWRKTKNFFYCPNGHNHSYSKSTEAFLREQLEEKNRLLSTKDFEIARLERLNKRCKKVKK